MAHGPGDIIGSEGSLGIIIIIIIIYFPVSTKYKKNFTYYNTVGRSIEYLSDCQLRTNWLFSNERVGLTKCHIQYQSTVFSYHK